MNELNREQPATETEAGANAAEAAAQMDESAGSQNESSGEGGRINSLGKFASEHELLRAYENLEGAFTRKSQELAALKKGSEENQKQVSQPEPMPPHYERSDWAARVQNFLRENKAAKEYAGEISSILLEDKRLQASERPLEDAWNVVAARRYNAPESLMQSTEFLNKYVYSNNAVREKILHDYFASNSGITNSAPPIIATKTPQSIALSKAVKVATLGEAKNYLLDLLKNP